MQQNERGFNILVVIFIAAVILSIFGLWYGVASAQALPEPTVTTFAPHCYTITDGQLTAYFGYTSTGVERYMGSGYDVTTQAGAYPDALSVTVEAFAAPELPVITLGHYVEYQDAALAVFNGVDKTVTIEFDVSVLPICGAEESPAPIPTVDSCPAWAINGATGERFCMWSLPKVGDWQ